MPCLENRPDPSPWNDPEEAVDVALHGTDPVERESARAFAANGLDDEALRRIVGLLDAPRKLTRRRVARLFSEAPAKRARPVLEEAMDSDSPRVRAAATRTLAHITPEGHPAIDRALLDPDPSVRRAALGSTTPNLGVLRALADPDPSVSDRASWIALRREMKVDTQSIRQALTNTGSEEHRDRLIRLQAIADPAAEELLQAARDGRPVALDHMEDQGTWREMLEGPHRVAAAWALARLDKAPTDDLVRLAEDPDGRVRAAAARGLGASDPTLDRLVDDSSAMVRWFARESKAGRYEPNTRQKGSEPHDRSNSPSAHPPYGLPPIELPRQVARAGLALWHPQIDTNLGVSIRSAEAAGFDTVIIIGRSEYTRTSARGTDHHIAVETVPDAAALVRWARETGRTLVGIQQTPVSVPYHRATYPPDPVFVAGAEGTGLPTSLRHEADLMVEIPMFGAIDSLNLASAVTCVIFHWRLKYVELTNEPQQYSP